ncbi:hypothetical protein CSV65_10860 [Sporosarcina sp. P31]|nr:hypothetical protein CSV68_14375 [Sporosarcina sp. P29]PID05288.1 hypothetical protein CSV66_10455 [Sporosarcina sp. P30]PID08406.1 hypothetical protein CSV65_10860 [Sporosarcina sp. P31]
MHGIATPAGDAFRRAWLEPSEQRRVRFALISVYFTEIKASVQGLELTLILPESPQLPLQSLRRELDDVEYSLAMWCELLLSLNLIKFRC